MDQKTYASSNLFVLASWWEYSGVCVDLDTIFTDKEQAEHEAARQNAQNKPSQKNIKRVLTLDTAIDDLRDQAKAGADINAKDGRGFAAVHHVASCGDCFIMDVLMEAGVDLGAVDGEGMSASERAIEGGHVKWSSELAMAALAQKEKNEIQTTACLAASPSFVRRI